MKQVIDYKKINQEISQQKWDRIHNKTVDEFTCYYSPNEGHDLCTHPEHCILNKEFQQLRGKIRWERDYIDKLERIYDDALIDKEKFPDKDYTELFVGFTPKRNRVKRAVIQRSISNSYRDLKNLKTKKGGF